MAMTKLKEELVKAANNELNRANEKFPLFNSKHEGAAVIYEELEESKEALEILESSFMCMWDEPCTRGRKRGSINGKNRRINGRGKAGIDNIRHNGRNTIRAFTNVL